MFQLDQLETVAQQKEMISSYYGLNEWLRNVYSVLQHAASVLVFHKRLNMYLLSMAYKH